MALCVNNNNIVYRSLTSLKDGSNFLNRNVKTCKQYHKKGLTNKNNEFQFIYSGNETLPLLLVQITKSSQS